MEEKVSSSIATVQLQGGGGADGCSAATIGDTGLPSSLAAHGLTTSEW